MTDFWILRSPERKSDGFRGVAQWDGEHKLHHDGIICPVNSGHNRAGPRRHYVHIVLDQHVNWAGGVVWTAADSECLVTDQVKEIIEAAKLTGIEFRPCCVRFDIPRSDPPPRLWELRPIGFGGLVSDASLLRYVDTCLGCGYVRYSQTDKLAAARLVDETLWDRSDYFKVWPAGNEFLSPRFRQVIQQNRIGPATLFPAREVIFRGMTYGVAPPEHMFPKPTSEKIRKLAEAAGLPVPTARYKYEDVG